MILVYGSMTGVVVLMARGSVQVLVEDDIDLPSVVMITPVAVMFMFDNAVELILLHTTQ